MSSYNITIHTIKTVHARTNAWSINDYKKLLEILEIDSMGDVSDAECLEYLNMAISDLEPHEAAQALLTYRLSDKLTEGQIQQVAHDMLEDKACEEYPDISAHALLFDINQFLYTAYNGKFPNAEASIIEVTILPASGQEEGSLEADSILRCLHPGISDHSVLHRLFEDQLTSSDDFPEAKDILWNIEAEPEHKYVLTTSDYWLNQEDFIEQEFEATLVSS